MSFWQENFAFIKVCDSDFIILLNLKKTPEYKRIQSMICPLKYEKNGHEINFKLDLIN